LHWDNSNHYRIRLKEAEKFRAAASKPAEIEMWDHVINHWVHMIELREQEEQATPKG